MKLEALQQIYQDISKYFKEENSQGATTLEISYFQHQPDINEINSIYVNKGFTKEIISSFQNKQLSSDELKDIFNNYFAVAYMPTLRVFSDDLVREIFIHDKCFLISNYHEHSFYMLSILCGTHSNWHILDFWWQHD